MSLRYSKYLKFIHLISDLFLLNISFILAYLYKFGSYAGLLEYPYSYLLVFFNVSWVLLATFLRPYSIARTSRIRDILKSHLSLIIVHVLLVTAFFVVEKAYYYSREQLLGTYILFVFLLFIWKISFTYIIRGYRKQGYNYRKVVIVGYGELSQELKSFFSKHPEHGYKLLGFFDSKSKGGEVLGNFSDLQEYAKTEGIDEIYCCLPYIRYRQVKQLIDFGEENLIKVKLIADFRGFSLKSLNLERYDHIPVLNVSSIPLDDLRNRIVKRSFDVMFSSFIIILLLSWLIPLISLAIMLESKGPVFFKQKRTGKDNKSFFCLKFRTMVVNSECDDQQAMKNDCRVTRFGVFLRKTSLDELPQFFNVWVGQMSVVGPRPHMLKHTEEYSKIVEKFMARHFVKPGITGLAQAKGFRGETKEVELMKSRVKLDRFYVENWSLNFDIKIIILTIISMIRDSRNAY